MIYDQDDIQAKLLNLTIECARPSWRFRLLFGAMERQLLGFAINTFMSQRQQNMLINELDRRYCNYGRGSPGAQEQQAPARASQ